MTSITAKSTKDAVLKHWEAMKAEMLKASAEREEAAKVARKARKGLNAGRRGKRA
jgi:hypothetical protein